MLVLLNSFGKLTPFGDANRVPAMDRKASRDAPPT